MNMGLKLENVVPWGRSLQEYGGMFALNPNDLHCRILDCGGGPASFNAEMSQRGYAVISCDPIYQFSASEIRQRVQDTYTKIVEGVRAAQANYIWTQIKSPEALGEVRLAAMQQFLQDFEPGLQAGRYVAAELPALPFGDRQFDLALCGHLLFTYSDPLSLDFHVRSLQELCRVAVEVRVFPVLNIDSSPSPWLQPVMEKLQQMGYACQLMPVPYEFQKGANQLLQVRLAQGY